MSDRILYTLSTRGGVPREFFHELLEDFAEASNSGETSSSSFDLRREFSRLLDALGHCEFDYERNYVWACPPSFILLPTSGLFQAVLSGARTPALMQTLKKAVRQNNLEASIDVSKHIYETVPLPSVVTVSATSLDVLKAIASTSGIRWASDQPGALRLASFSVDRDHIANQLTFTERPDMNWQSKIFSIQQLSFTRIATENNYRLVSYISPTDKQLLHWLWDGTRAAIVDRDWGRFIALAHSDKQVIFYDSRRQRLCVPSTTWLPALLARALTLCSGQAPARHRLSSDYLDISSNQPFHVYAGVPAYIADLVCQKIGQRLINARCAEDEALITPC